MSLGLASPTRRGHAKGAALILILSTVGYLMLTAANAGSLGAVRWQARPLLIFAPNQQHADVQRQLSAVAENRAQLLDRDMLVYLITTDGVIKAVGEGPDLNATKLRQTFGVDSDEMLALLVGKDGGVKRRARLPVRLETLFALIDSMPMRREEMRRDGTN